MIAARTPAERVRRFIARRELVAPGSTVVWSDHLCAAVALRLDDLRAVLDELEAVTDQSRLRDDQRSTSL